MNWIAVSLFQPDLVAEEKLSKRIVSLEGSKAGLSERPVAMVIGAGKEINCRGSAFEPRRGYTAFLPISGCKCLSGLFRIFCLPNAQFPTITHPY